MKTLIHVNAPMKTATGSDRGYPTKVTHPNKGTAKIACAATPAQAIEQ